MKTFHTESSPRKGQITMFCTYLGMALLSLLGLKVSLVTCLYFEGLVLACMLLCFFFVSKTRWILDFHGRSLLLTNTGNRRQYRLDELSAADFHFSQSERQRRGNRCDLKLANLLFGIYDLHDCDALKRYVRENYTD